jgi:hypothetical protein
MLSYSGNLIFLVYVYYKYTNSFSEETQGKYDLD